MKKPYQIRQIRLTEELLEEQQLLTIVEAAKLLGCTTQNISQALDRGTFTTIIDAHPTGARKRRLLLRSEVEARAKQGRKKKAPNPG